LEERVTRSVDEGGCLLDDGGCPNRHRAPREAERGAKMRHERRQRDGEETADLLAIRRREEEPLAELQERAAQQSPGLEAECPALDFEASEWIAAVEHDVGGAHVGELDTGAVRCALPFVPRHEERRRVPRSLPPPCKGRCRA